MDLCLTFNCNGKVNSNDWELSKESLFLRGELENVLYPQDECSLSDMDVQLFDCTVPAATAVFDLKHFNKCLDMQLKILSRHETYNQVLYSKTDDIDFYYIRRIICEFILYIRTYLNRGCGISQTLRFIMHLLSWAISVNNPSIICTIHT